MTDLTHIIAEWRKRGSEGPWTLERKCGDTYLRDANGCLIMNDVEFYPEPVTNEVDWHFIHAAPAMADRIEALEAENTRLRKALFDAFDNIDAGLYDEASAILRNGITGSRVARDDSEAAT